MTGESLLPCVESGPASAARASVVWLHGLGADGHDFAPIVPQLALPPDVRFVFPHAPSLPVSINGGFVMPAWYDIAEVDLARRHDEAGIRRSSAHVEALLRRERERGVPSERTFLAGFSQGGAIALFTGLRHGHRLAGIIGLSCYLVCAESLATERNPANADTPVFLAHGSRDPMVSVERGRAGRDAVVALGSPVSWREDPMQHEVCLEEIAALGAWMSARLDAVAG